MERTKCWCGGTLNDSIHPFYGQCSKCSTLVLKRYYSNDELKELYTFDYYWHNHQENISKLPAIEERAFKDNTGRILYWYYLLKKFKKSSDNLLEIGCSHGGYLAYCKIKGIKNVVGIEVDKKTCDFAKKTFNLTNIIHGLFPDVNLPFNKFNAIVLFDVLEHFSDPVKAIRTISDLLTDNGLLILQTPCYRDEDKNWDQFRPDEHIFLFNKFNISKLLKSADLKLFSILPGFFLQDMIVIAYKNNCFPEEVSTIDKSYSRFTIVR